MFVVRLKTPHDGSATDVSLERADPGVPGKHRVTLAPAPGETGAATTFDVEVERSASGAGRLRIAGRVSSFHACREDHRIWVWVAGRVYAFEVDPRTARRATGGAAGGVDADLTAPMPGKVLEIKATAGDVFEAHAPLIVMESMKMEMTLSAPGPVRVREILCSEGELVEMGEVLARLEAAADATETS